MSRGPDIPSLSAAERSRTRTFAPFPWDSPSKWQMGPSHRCTPLLTRGSAAPRWLGATACTLYPVFWEEIRLDEMRGCKSAHHSGAPHEAQLGPQVKAFFPPLHECLCPGCLSNPITGYTVQIHVQDQTVNIENNHHSASQSSPWLTKDPTFSWMRGSHLKSVEMC